MPLAMNEVFSVYRLVGERGEKVMCGLLCFFSFRR